MLHVKKLYEEKETFVSLYFGSICITILLIVIEIGIIMTVYILTNLKAIKNNWAAERCKPLILPFVSLINKPPHKSSLLFTEENFIFCQQNSLKAFWYFLLKPVHMVIDEVTNVFKDIQDQIQSLRELISNIRTMAMKVFTDMLGAIELLLVPVQQFILIFKDTMHKITGVITAALYQTMGIYFLMQSSMKIMMDAIIGVLIIFAVIIASLFLGIFTIPIAIAALTVYFTIKNPFQIIISFMENVLKISPSNSLPKDPKQPAHLNTCFAEFTQTPCGKTFLEVEVGDEIAPNCFVTAKFVLKNTNSVFYRSIKYPNIVVTSKHKIWEKEKDKYIEVMYHHEFEQFQNYHADIVYCLNTTTQQIPLKEYIFMDWDEGDNIKYLPECEPEPESFWGIVYLPEGNKQYFR
jgi:hypothetical protein